MEELALVLSGLSFVLMIAVTFILLKRKNENTLFLDRQDKEELVVSFNSNAKTISGVLQQSVDNLGKNVQIQLDNMSEKIKDNREMTEKRFELIEKKVEEK